MNDVLCVDEEPRIIRNLISNIYRVKPKSIKCPGTYLGMNVRKWEIQSNDGKLMQTYALGANTYVEEAIRIAKVQTHKHNLIFPVNKRQSKIPFTSPAYRPELDSSELCNSELHTLFQNFMGMLQWVW